MKPVDPARIAQRMSLRAPLAEALGLLAGIVETLNLRKDLDLAHARALLAQDHPSFSDFERAFPSLTFDIATGVGKTRLMGAFVAWLHLTGRSANFLVLAPNGTIYRKLVEDFTPGTPKYVFTGISELATNPPIVVTGDDYGSGHGARRGQQRLGDGDPDTRAVINVFNIQKINQTADGSRELRIRRLSETIGQSYFEYLRALPDLVLLMDESHRYRAKAGFQTLNELSPVLGLELTATPFVQNGSTKVPFRNVVYSFPLKRAMEAGYVKEPACTVRPDLALGELTPEQLDRLKLEDGLRIHEETKTNLLLYAKESGREPVKPFVLVVARDTAHADELKALLESEAFADGAYAGKVIVVTSTQSGEEKEENNERLQRVERYDDPTEIVIHVHMLKEGWDVRNLYTLIPLNPAHSAQMVEQSIGRGLRLPYGQRTGDPRADNLTVVAHDRYAEILQHSRSAASMFQVKTLELPPDGAPRPPRPLQAPSTVELALGLATAVLGSGTAAAPLALPAPAGAPTLAVPGSFTPAQARSVAGAAFRAVQRAAGRRSAGAPFSAAGRDAVVEAAKAELAAAGEAVAAEDTDAVAAVVAQVFDVAERLTIDVPQVSVAPTGEVRFVIEPFELDGSAMDWRPVESRLVVERIRTGERFEVRPEVELAPDQDLRSCIVQAATASNELAYEDHADLLYDLAEQAIAHLTARLGAADAVRTVVLTHQEAIGRILREQALAHGREVAAGYETRVSYVTLGLAHVHVALPHGATPRSIWEPVQPLSATRSAVFAGMKRCLTGVARFDSDGERRLATVLEHDPLVVCWLKPPPAQLPIPIPGGGRYDPDFLAATADARYVVEVKARSELGDPEVEAKARAGAVWCAAASEHDAAGRPWRYLLVPDDVIDLTCTLEGLWKRFGRTA